MNYSIGFVILMGIGVVFFGLVCIVAIISIMSACVRKFVKETPKAAAPVPVSASAATVTPAMAAAVAAVIAENMGTDVSAIRINSFKKI